MSNYYHYRHSIYEYIQQRYSISKLKHAHNALELLNQILNDLIRENKLHDGIPCKDGIIITIKRLFELAKTPNTLDRSRFYAQYIVNSEQVLQEEKEEEEEGNESPLSF